MKLRVLIVAAIGLGLAMPSQADFYCVPQTQYSPSGGGGGDPKSKNLRDGSADFSCQREFLYDEKQQTVDSYHLRNGEKLRDIIRDVPDAVSELNIYQENRRKIRKVAFLGTIGLVAAVLGWSLLENAGDEKNFRKAAILGGLGLTSGAWIYGVALASNNENHLQNAVNYYNRSRPEKKIELKFSTGIIF